MQRDCSGKTRIITSSKGLVNVLASTPNRSILEGLRNGQSFLLTGTYGTAMAFYTWLKKQVNLSYPVLNYQSSRANRNQLHGYTSRLYVRVINNSIDLANAPKVPWVEELFCEQNEFFIPFTDVLGINGAWQWYIKGVEFPNLGFKLHPFYDVYFPTRTEHLLLFDKWLESKPNFNRGIDMGTGCGVLTFYMLKHGVKEVLATDINPKALQSINNDAQRLNLSHKIATQQASLFQGINVKDNDIVVFNPPWIPDASHNDLDSAMYYPPDFFNTFFNQAYNSLLESCKLVIIFSTFAQAAGVIDRNPIERELTDNNRFTLIGMNEQPVMQKPSKKKHWLSDIRSKERVQLWELVKKT
ncbi:MAG: methyltransferase [Bacteroidales bacterium]